MKQVIIRADSSSTIGTGHIMRDLVLAKRDFKNDNVVFATRELEGNINHKISEAGHPIEILKSNDIEELDAVVKKYRADTIVIDHYGIDDRYEKRLSTLNPDLSIMVLDDTYEKHHCHILLNHNVYAEPSRYEGLVPKGCELRCGANHTLLRDEFTEAKKRGREKRKDRNRLNVFIAMGGADTSNLNIPILEILEEQKGMHAHVVTTRANRHLIELQSYVKSREHVTLHIETDKIAKLMAEADFAIVTPSVTINEVFFMELPFIAIQTADNQKEMSAYLKQRGYPLLETFDEKRLRTELSAMVEFLHTELIDFTRLSEKEKHEVLTWRNHPEIRWWMHHTDPITLDEHFHFIESLKTKNDRQYYMVKIEEDPIGVIDFTQIDREKSCAHIGLYTKPSTRGKGKILMRKILEHGYNVLGLEKLIAEVYDTNEKAINLYRHFGFEHIGDEMSNNRNLLRMERKR